MNLPSGVIIKPITKFNDERGWLSELFRIDELFDLNDFDIQQGYFSYTNPGVRRGPHQHEFQSDYFCFLNGEFLLQLWDARIPTTIGEFKVLNIINFNNPEKNLDSFNDITRSKEFMLNSLYEIKVGENNPCVVIVPPGVIHTYTNISKFPAFTLNFPDKLYKGFDKQEEVDEIRYEENPLLTAKKEIYI